MAAFQDDERTWERVDWRILRAGAVSLYHHRDLLESHAGWLEGHGYRVVTFDAAAWPNRVAALRNIGQALGFPSHYGRHPGDLNKCLGNLEVPDPGGLALVFMGFDAYHRADPLAAWHLLDNIEFRSRQFLLTGKRLMALAHSEDRDLRLPPVGGRHIARNWMERSRAHRGSAG